MTAPLQTQAWLISFGDVLTLLLCFFLAIISLSTPSTKIYLAKSISSEEMGSFKSSGIVIAKKDVRARAFKPKATERSFLLGTGDLGADEGERISKVAHRLKRLMSLKGYSVKSVGVSLYSRDASKMTPSFLTAVMDLERHIVDTLKVASVVELISRPEVSAKRSIGKVAVRFTRTNG